MSSVAANINRLRMAKGLSQSGLADCMREAGATHWRQNTVSRIERGLQPPTFAEVEELASILGHGVLQGTKMEHFLVRQLLDDSDAVAVEVCIRRRAPRLPSAHQSEC